MDKKPKNCYIPTSVGPTSDGILEAPLLTAIALALFGSMLTAMLVAPFVKDDHAMGIKTSYGAAGPEFDAPTPAPAIVPRNRKIGATA